MNIAIIEYQSDIDEALKYFSPQRSLYLSVSAEASYHLSKRHIDFLTDEEVMTPRQFKKLGNENFDITAKWIQLLEEMLQSKNKVFKEKQFCPFKWHFYRLKILVDAVRIRKILIDRLIEKLKPLALGIPAGVLPCKIHNHHLFFRKYDSLYGLLGNKIAQEKGIETRIWQRNASTNEKWISVDGIIKYLNIKKLLNRGLAIISRMKDLLKRKCPEDNILLGNLGYDIKLILSMFSKKYNFYLYKEPLSISYLNSYFRLKSDISMWDSLNIDIKALFKETNATGDAIVDEILGERVQAYSERFIPILWEGLSYLESIDRKKKFQSYIDTVGASDAFYGLPTYYFSREKRPFIAVQHGAYGFVLNRHTEFCEFGHDGCFISWGNGIKKMYEKRKKGSCRIIPTGSNLIEEIRRKSKPRETISKVCYVPTTYRGYTAYYPNGQSCLDSKMFIMETNFLLTLKPYLKKYQITYKVSPDAVMPSPIFGKNPMIEWVKQNIPEMKIESRTLKSVIYNFDLFIIDFPSTTLVQACATGAEIVVYAGNKYHSPTKDSIKLLRKRAVVGESEKDFQNKIRKVLEGGVVISNVEDTSFLERYGIYKDDGKSLERITNTVRYILQKRNI